MPPTAFVPFHGISLDPMAQEFRPTIIPYGDFTFIQPHIYYPYTLPEIHLTPQFPLPLPYVASLNAEPSLPPPLPPSTHTPSRTLLLSSVPTDVSESAVRRDLEVFGDVRLVQMERIRSGIVTVHFYDLRDAECALGSIQEQHMQQQCRLRKHFDTVLAFNHLHLVTPLPPPAPGLIYGRAVWAQFITNAPLESPNQGTIIVFNLEHEVSSSALKQIFQPFGAIKELRETPFKKHQKFIEFFDVRDAAKAVSQMNGKEIYGSHVVIEFSRPGGGHHKKFSKLSTNIQTAKSNHHSPPPPIRDSGNNMPQPPQTKKSVFVIVNASSNSGTKNFKEEYHPSKNRSLLKKSSNANNTCSGRQWKGSSRGSREYDPRYLINEDAVIIANSRDTRTTVMIKNIPNKYSQKLLLNMLDNHCIQCNDKIAEGDGQPLSAFDFVYLPIDFINKCNVGYGFVNMTTPEATLRLYKSFHLSTWEIYNSRKICEVTYARLQGIEALKDHFKNSKFPCETGDYLPVLFSPPRDGRELSEPFPIVPRPMCAAEFVAETASNIKIRESMKVNDEDDGWQEKLEAAAMVSNE